MNSIGEADIDDNLAKIVIEEMKKEKGKRIQQNKAPVTQCVEPKQKKKQQQFYGYASNDSVLGKLDAGSIISYYSFMV